MPTAYNVSQAAAIVGVSPSSLRNWCKLYAAHLSPGASPPTGGERILTPADVATLQRVKALRDALRDYDQIVTELATMPLDGAVTPYIDTTVTLAPTEAPPVPPATPQATDILTALQIAMDSRYNQLQGQIDAMGNRQGERLQWFVLGVGVGILLVVAAVVIVWLGAWWR